MAEAELVAKNNLSTRRSSGIATDTTVERINETPRIADAEAATAAATTSEKSFRIAAEDTPVAAADNARCKARSIVAVPVLSMEKTRPASRANDTAPLATAEYTTAKNRLLEPFSSTALKGAALSCIA